MSGRDDDALRWEGDDDPTLDVGAAAPAAPAAPRDDPAAEPVALPDGFTAVGKDSASVGRIEADGSVVMPGEREPLSTATLLALGVLAGVYLLFTIGWIVGGIRLQGTAQYLVSPVGYQAAFWLAVIAPVVWFGTAYVLTRSAKAWVWISCLVAGLVLLVPWPFVMVGAVGTVAS